MNRFFVITLKMSLKLTLGASPSSSLALRHTDITDEIIDQSIDDLNINSSFFLHVKFPML